jgi:hypothetical protein
LRVAWVAAIWLAAHAFPAVAQDSGLIATLEAASDERRRGLGWSEGAPVLRATLSIPIASGLSLDGASTSLWDSARHGGADGVIDIGPNWSRQFGDWRLTVQGRYHLFPGSTDQDYGEIGAQANLLVGPASIDIATHYAPRQSAIGGDNLYLSLAAATAISGTPFTLSGHIGRSSGHLRDPIAAARLRPDGTYWDHGVSLDWYRGRWFAGMDYVGSRIDATAGAHNGSRLIARIGISL